MALGRSFVKLPATMRTLDVIWVFRWGRWGQITEFPSFGQMVLNFLGFADVAEELLVFGTPIRLFGLYGRTFERKFKFEIV